MLQNGRLHKHFEVVHNLNVCIYLIIYLFIYLFIYLSFYIFIMGSHLTCNRMRHKLIFSTLTELFWEI